MEAGATKETHCWRYVPMMRQEEKYSDFSLPNTFQSAYNSIIGQTQPESSGKAA